MQKLSIDIDLTKALLVAVSDYEHLPEIKPALHNVEDLAVLLKDPEVLGLADNHVKIIKNLSNDKLYDAIEEFINHEDNLDIQTLIFYYVGHGIRATNSKDLYLTGTNTKNSSITRSGILYTDIKSLLENSQIQKRVIILDACHSGLAALDGNKYTDSEIDLKGSYTLTSAAWDKQAFYDPNARNTVFTTDFFNALTLEFSNTEKFISMENLFKHLVKKSSAKSIPQRKSNLNSSDIILFKNKKYNLDEALKKANNAFNSGYFQLAMSIYVCIAEETPAEFVTNRIRECKSLVENNKPDKRFPLVAKVIFALALLALITGAIFFMHGRESTIILKPGTLAPNGNITFQSDGNTIQQSCYGRLDTLAAVIKLHPRKFTLAGYSSDVNNAMALSVSRAQSIKNYLVKKGVNANDIIVKGYGASHPIAPNNTELGRTTNTRVEFHQ